MTPPESPGPPPVDETVVFRQLGEDGLETLVAAFYRRVRVDDLLAPMYPRSDWEGAARRLRDFLIFRFGGPPRYVEERGHPRLRMRHAPFPIDSAARDRWLSLMGAAMEETGVPDPSASILGDYFALTADFMRNRPDAVDTPPPAE